MKAGATLVVIDPRRTSLAKQASLHLAPQPGTDLPLALAIHNYLFERGFADTVSSRNTRGAEQLREKASGWTIARAADVAGVDPESLERLAHLYATTSPAVVRCGWGSSAIAMVEAPPQPCSRFQRSPASLVSAAAAIR